MSGSGCGCASAPGSGSTRDSGSGEGTGAGVGAGTTTGEGTNVGARSGDSGVISATTIAPSAVGAAAPSVGAGFGDGAIGMTTVVTGPGSAGARATSGS